MEVTNIGNGKIEISATYEEVGAIALAVDSKAINKNDDYLKQLAYELFNPKVRRK